MKTLPARLGLTPQCAALLALTVLAMTLAVIANLAPLYGTTAVLAFLAGTTWDRHLFCDDCHTALEDR